MSKVSVTSEQPTRAFAVGIGAAWWSQAGDGLMFGLASWLAKGVVSFTALSSTCSSTR
jgi:hypothetical protein